MAEPLPGVMETNMSMNKEKLYEAKGCAIICHTEVFMSEKRDSDLDLRTVWELHGYTFVIPYQQRGYKWTKDNVINLLDDLIVFRKEVVPFYCLQPIAVVPVGKEEEHKYSVVDGQQRLTTLYLLYKYLVSDGADLSESTELFHYEYERDKNNERRNLLQKRIENENDATIDFFYITQAYLAIKKWFEDRQDAKGLFLNLLKEADTSRKFIQVIWYTVGEDKKHDVFRNINSGKIQLTNLELIKALLLNRQNGIPNQEFVALQFGRIERQLEEDRFWFMMCKKDVNRKHGQSRMDLLFNLVEGIPDEEYQTDPRASFFHLAKLDSSALLAVWKKVCEAFQRLKDIFDDPYAFHYVGFLTSFGGSPLKSILDKSEFLTKSEFLAYLRDEVKNCLGRVHDKLEDYSYGDGKERLCRLFVLHNIESILQRYENLKETRGLRFSYEYFPFELLEKQSWNIEHIASRTDNDLTEEKTRKDWLNSMESDYQKVVKDAISQEKWTGDFSDKKKFDSLYKAIVKEVETDSISERKKDGIGNLVLLDEHTNKSFHNALFPSKRKIVLTASGLRNKSDSKNNLKDVKSVYVPLCTQQVYTKAYNKSTDVKLNSWTKADYDAYLADMKEKLAFYFDGGEK